MVHRYAAVAFRRYGAVRRLSPAQATAELELFDELMLRIGLRAGEAGRCVAARTPPDGEPAGHRTASHLREPSSWTT